MEINMDGCYYVPSFAFFKTLEDAIEYLRNSVCGVYYYDDEYRFECMKETHVEINTEKAFFMRGVPYSVDEDYEYGGLKIHTIRIKRCSDLVLEQDSVSILTECPGYYNYTMGIIGNEDMEYLTHWDCFNNSQEGIDYVTNAVKRYNERLALFNARYPDPSSLEMELYKPNYPFPTSHFSWEEECGIGKYEGRYMAIITYDLGKIYANNPTLY